MKKITSLVSFWLAGLLCLWFAGDLLAQTTDGAAALSQFKAKQTGTQDNGYGVCVAIDKGGNGFGHGGAYATDIWIDTKNQLVTIYLVQHNGYAGADGGKILPTFKQAAVTAFGSK